MQCWLIEANAPRLLPQSGVVFCLEMHYRLRQRKKGLAVVRNEILSFDEEKFRNVSDLKMGVVYAWIWNSEITKEYIDEELLYMKKLGIKGV